MIKMIPSKNFLISHRLHFSRLNLLGSNKSSIIKGFTIIELLVVITMVGIVAGVGIFSLVNYGNSQSLEQGVGNIKKIFDEAKFNALSSIMLESDSEGNSVSCIDGLIAYKVDVVPSSTDPDTILLYMECGGSSDLVSSYTLSSNLNLDVDTTCDEVSYEALTVNASALPDLPCTVTIEGFNQTKTIYVDLLGNLNIQ